LKYSDANLGLLILACVSLSYLHQTSELTAVELECILFHMIVLNINNDYTKRPFHKTQLFIDHRGLHCARLFLETMNTAQALNTVCGTGIPLSYQPQFFFDGILLQKIFASAMESVDAGGKYKNPWQNLPMYKHEKVCQKLFFSLLKIITYKRNIKLTKKADQKQAISGSVIFWILQMWKGRKSTALLNRPHLRNNNKPPPGFVNQNSQAKFDDWFAPGTQNGGEEVEQEDNCKDLSSYSEQEIEKYLSTIEVIVYQPASLRL